MDRQQMEHCLERVAAYRASGQRSQQWALANGVKPHELSSWCAHAGRWQAKLDGVVLPPAACKPPIAFVAARVPASTSYVFTGYPPCAEQRQGVMLNGPEVSLVS